MRIISGSARGRRLKEPAGFEIRPTSDLVKESVFNIIQFGIIGKRALDLFAGTGQLGIEALSRGAKSAVFVDSKPEAVKLIRDNLKLCGFTGLAHVYNCDALKYLGGGYSNRTPCDSFGFRTSKAQKSGKGRGGAGNQADDYKFDLIILDPPYNTPLAEKALLKIIEFDILNQDGIIICEIKANDSTPTATSPYFLQKEYRYGSVKIAKYIRATSS